jgi:hypothetical protein
MGIPIVVEFTKLHYQTHSFGPLFWHTIRLTPESPKYHRYLSHETDEPFRKANAHIFRLRKDGSGLVVGLWRKTSRSEQEMLLDAMQGRQMDDREFTEAEKTHIRRNLVRKQISAEDQELLVEALDL